MDLLNAKVTEPRVSGIEYQDGLIVLTLTGTALKDAVLSFDPRAFGPLAKATDEQLADVVTTPGGGAILWKALDVDIATPALCLAALGISAARMAGSAGGRKSAAVESEAKRAAARANGAKGGRPAGSKNKPKSEAN